MADVIAKTASDGGGTDNDAGRGAQVGDITVDDMTVGDMTAGNMMVSNKSVGNVTSGNMTDGNIETGNNRSGNIATGDDAAGNSAPGTIAAGNDLAAPVNGSRAVIRHSGTGSIEVHALSHMYAGRDGNQQALADIDMIVAPGHFVVLVGPSGCGKTSLLMMLAGLRAHTAGSILCDGRPITGPDPNRIGVVFQEANLFPWLSALDNVAFPLTLRRVKPAERRRRAMDMLRLVRLEEFAGRYPYELSGGMRQRVSIARGLVQDPPVLLMDEPFAALDEQTRMAMGDELLRIWSETRKTVVFVTHSLTEAVYLADEVLVMSARPGRIIDRIAVDLPRPRSYATMSAPDFVRLRDRIWHHIRAERA